MRVEFGLTLGLDVVALNISYDLCQKQTSLPVEIAVVVLIENAYRSHGDNG